MVSTLRPLCIGDLTARVPIVQGGMGVGISLSGLASAVADEGGIGVIASAGIGMTEPDFFTDYAEANLRALRTEIRKARAATHGHSRPEHHGGASRTTPTWCARPLKRRSISSSRAPACRSTCRSIATRDTHTKLVPIVSSGRAAALLCKRWTTRFDYLPDALVVEGPRAGGHLGFTIEQIADPAFALERLVPEVIEAVRPFAEAAGKAIPVIAAGGIYTGADIRRFLEMGAAGVQMATRFVTTHECDASEAFKQTYLDAKEEDIMIIKSPVGNAGARHSQPVHRGDQSRGKAAVPVPLSLHHHL